MKTLKSLFLTLLLALPLAAGAAQRPATPFTDAELDALLAPIALYPDTVLSHVLIAATVPEDVEEAADWAGRHPNLEGQAAVDAVERKPWDPSVKALVAFPEVLDRMVEDPDWTDDLGLAFLEQEADVMDRVQYLRDRAHESGALDDIEHVRVVREREYIYLEPAVRTVYYVPYYDPWYVYGSWWWPAYPPHRWHYWAGYPAHHYHGSTFYWGVSYHVGPSFYVSTFNWPRRHVVVSREHRYYTPQGYSGRSTMRRSNVAVNDSRRYHGGSSWRQGPATPGTRRPRPERPTHPTHPTHPEHPAHPDHPNRPGSTGRGRGHDRRSWTDVRAELAARRSRAEGLERSQGAGRSEASRDNAYGRTARGDTVSPQGRSSGAPRPRHEGGYREAPPRDNGQGRARVERAPQARGSESRDAAPRSVPRESRESRGESRSDSHGRGNGGTPRGQPNGHGRGQRWER